MSLPNVASPSASAAPSAGAADSHETLGTGAPNTTGAAGTAPAGGGSATGPGGFGFLPIILMMVVLMVLMTTMTGRKDRKRRASMMSGLKKHDKVVTVGGIIGQVAEIRDDEVTLLIDESSRTKMRVTKASIQQVLTPAAGGSGSGTSGKDADELASPASGAAEVKVKGKLEKVSV